MIVILETLTSMLHAKAAVFLRFAYALPRYQAPGARSCFCACPQEGSLTGINGITHSEREHHGAHCIYGDAIEHRVDEDGAASRAEQCCFPTRQVTVHLGDQRRGRRELQLNIR
jgi:hypothetical protein